MPQSLSKIYIHLIFSTKNRERNIYSAIENEMFAVIADAINRLDCRTLVVGGDADHIHALFCLSRNKTVGEVVRDVKANASKWYKRRTGFYFAWQHGYSAFSVSQSRVNETRDYILTQKEHHRSKSFQEEYREFLVSYGVSFDERFVWD